MPTGTADERVDVVVVGAGIVGLATARALLERQPGLRLTVVDKEPQIGRHQTGRNSGVVHAGVYYPPGSAKARLCTRGRELLERYAADRGLPYVRCGKLVVATTEAEADRLPELHRRAVANGVPDVRLLSAAEARAVEPRVRALAALHSPVTAITDFAAVARSYADDVRAAGGAVRTGWPVTGFEHRRDEVVVLGGTGALLRAGRVVLCAGLHVDRLAVAAGDEPEPRIVPFRGDYFRVVGPARSLVRGLVYPVPDPRYPFLGVHLTPTVRGELLVGPNAVLAPAREGYRIADLRVGELAAVLAGPGFRALAREHWRTGAAELWRSASRRAFARAARRYVPELRASDLRRAPAGVRAQALDPDGRLVDDFRIGHAGRVVAVRNAPSPAATSSLALGDELARRVLDS